MMSSKISAFCAVFIALSLTSCGSGVQGSGVELPPQPPLPSTQEPPVPVANYTGNRQLAVIDKTNAEYFAAQAVGLRTMTQLAESLWIELPPIRGAIDETITGSGGGTARIFGTVNTQDTGWLETEFQSFSEGGVVFNGRSIQRFRDRGMAPPEGGLFYSEAGTGSIEFDDLIISSGGAGLVLRGTVGITGFLANRFDVDLMVTDNTVGAVIYYEDSAIDFSMTGHPNNLRPSASMSGIIYDSILGAAQMSSVAPFPDMELFEPAGFVVGSGGGGIQLSSAGALIELRSLSRAFVGLMIDTDGDQTFDDGLRLSWSELAGIPETGNSVTSGPIANAGTDLGGYTGETFTVHGLYSHDDDRDWLTFDWQLLSKPFGSQLSLADSSAPMLTFAPDLDGDYFFALRVSDGTATRHTSVLARSERGPGSSLPVVTQTGDLEIAEPFQVGAPITVDGRSSTNRPYVADTPRWNSEGPGNRVLAETSNRFIRELTVDAEGQYLVSMNESNSGNLIAGTYNEVALTIGSGLYDRVIKVVGDYPGREVVQVDYNNDGRNDFIVRTASTMGIGFITYKANVNGGYDETPLVVAGVAEIAIGDLNGDGRIDVATSDGTQIYVSLQAEDESFSPGVPHSITSDNCTSTPRGQDIGIGDINGDGRDDLMAVNPCDRSVETWLQDMSGNLGPLTVQPFADRVIWGAFDDVDGDGRMDAVVGVQDQAFNDPPSLVYATGQTDGTFLFQERLSEGTPAVHAPGPVVGDTNNDGRKDLTMLNQFDVVMYEQQQDGSMALASTTGLNMDLSSAYASLADVDDDGDADILLCRLRDLYIGRRQPDGSYVYAEEGECLAAESNQNVGIVTDITGNGTSDLVLPATDHAGYFRNREEVLDLYLVDVKNYSRSVN